MLQTWTMDAPRDPDAAGSNDQVMRLLDEAGYTSVVAVNYEHEYLRELQHGERISVRSTAEDLSAEKKTALGVGSSRPSRHEYVTDDGEVVGIGRMRLLKFKPPAAAAPTSASRPAAADRPRQRLLLGGRRGRRAAHPAVQRLRRAAPPAAAALRASCGSADQGYVVSQRHAASSTAT